MHIRKIITAIEETYSEAGQPEDPPLRKVAVIAIVKNPYAGKAYQKDLSSLTAASEALGVQITELANKAMKPYAMQSYGKASVVGTAGEQQHGAAMVTTIYGNMMRDAAGGGGGVGWFGGGEHSTGSRERLLSVSLPARTASGRTAMSSYAQWCAAKSAVERARSERDGRGL